MKHLKLNKRSVIRWKVYIDRARMYIGYIQFFMLGVIFVKAFEDYPIGKLIFDHLYVSIPLLFVLFIVGSLIIGFLDTRFGLREEELRNASASNPVLREIQNDIKDLKSQLSEMVDGSK